MPYSANAAAVKRWLVEIKSGDTSFDSEIDTLRTEIARQIDNMAQRYTKLPIQNQYVKDSLADIEAEWCAGRFRKRRPYGGSAEQPSLSYAGYEKEAEQRLADLFTTQYWGITEIVGSNQSPNTSQDRFMGPA